MKGAILCGSKTFVTSMTSNYIKEKFPNTKWTYLDFNIDCNPDIVGDVFDIRTLFQMGLNKYDVVILDTCFIGKGITDRIGLLLTATLLARMGGIIIYTNMSRFYLTDMYINPQTTKKDKLNIEKIKQNYYSDNDDLIIEAKKILEESYKELANSVKIEFSHIKRGKHKIINNIDYVIFVKP